MLWVSNVFAYSMVLFCFQVKTDGDIMAKQINSTSQSVGSLNGNIIVSIVNIYMNIICNIAEEDK